MVRPIANGGVFGFMLLVLFTCSLLHQARFCLANEHNGTSSMWPLVEAGKMMMMMMMVNESRRKLGRFQICALCTCCAKTYCLASPCCYAINCNIPNRPFGFCSFTPKTCNCFRCHL